MYYAVGVCSQLFIMGYDNECLVHLVTQLKEKAV